MAGYSEAKQKDQRETEIERERERCKEEGEREREGERWKVELREERRGFIMDPASNAYSHVAEMPIVCLTPPMDILRRIQLKLAFIIVALANLLSSASLITLSSFFFILSKWQKFFLS